MGAGWPLALLCFAACVSSASSSLIVRTTAPVSGHQLIQPAPVTATSTTALRLVQRQDDRDPAICGYIDANPDRPHTCGSGYYCNSNNPYKVIACCVDASTDAGYDPYACDFKTRCYDSSVGTSVGTLTAGRSDHIYALSCSDADFPYCGTISFSDIGYKAFNCFAGLIQFTISAAARPTTSTSIVNNVSTFTATIKTTINSGAPTSIPGAVPPSTSTKSNGGDNNHEVHDESPASTAAITGGAVGGVAFIAVAAALLFFLRRRKKKSQKEPTELSFSVIGLQPTPSENQDPKYRNAALARNVTEPLSYPNPVEVPTNLDRPRDVAPVPPVPAPSPSPDLTPTYQAYHPQHASAMTFSSNSLSLGQPVLSPQSSSYRPSQYPSHASFMPTVPEVHGHSASNSRGSSSTQTEARNRAGSRFAEHNAPQLSSQSGPVSEWHM